MAIPSVRPSVCLSHGWISQKRLKLGSHNFHHTVAPHNQQQAVYCYFAPVGDAKYVDEYVCASVYLLVRERKKVVV